MKNKINIILAVLLVIVVIGLIIGIIGLAKKPEMPPEKPPVADPTKVSDFQVENVDYQVNTELNFDTNLIKAMYSQGKDKNFIFSPYSIEIFLNMLKEASNGPLKEEINNFLNGDLVTLNNKDLLVSNSIFINPTTGTVNDSYVTTIKSKFSGEVFRELNAAKINNWVSNKTNKMITKVVEDSDLVESRFVLLNAIYMDSKWENKFVCNNTRKAEFTKIDGSQMDVNMMSKTFESGAKYIDGDVKGIILPYKGNQMEFIALLPDDVNSFIDSLNNDYIANLDNNAIPSEQDKLIVSLPRFNYEYENQQLINVLYTLGVKSMDNLDFACPDNECFISKIFHKAKIDLDENGTKAAAVTGGVAKNSAMIGEQTHIINFNKPFVYIIRDVATKKVVFFGITYEPTAYKEASC